LNTGTRLLLAAEGVNVKPLMLQQQLHSIPYAYRRALVCGSTREVAALLEQAESLLGGPDAVLRIIQTAGETTHSSARLERVLHVFATRGIAISRERRPGLDGATAAAIVGQNGYDVVFHAVAESCGRSDLDLFVPQLLAGCACDLWVCTGIARHPIRRILAAATPFGHSSGVRGVSRKAVAAATALAERSGGKLHVFPAAWITAPDAACDFCEIPQVVGSASCTRMRRDETVLGTHGIDVVVVGVAGKPPAGLKRLFAATGRESVWRTRCSVLIVRF
jgi:hypothetical protein